MEKFDGDSLVITIDGPAGAGKSTIAKQLAKRLGFEFLDTGAMYRCVTLAVLRSGFSTRDTAKVVEVASKCQIKLQESRVFLDGEDVSEAIRSPEVAANIGAIADNVDVRRQLTERQRAWAEGRCVVTEGRDQGSVVFHDSPCKIFLVASSLERARRRVAELQDRGLSVKLEEILEQQNRRDHEDETRPVGALLKADDATVVNTDSLDLEEVLDKVLDIVHQRIGCRT